MFAFARRGRRGPDPSPESGITLVELLTYMIILSIALAIALAAVVQMSRVLLDTKADTDATTALWRATTLMERQVRNAQAVNVPGPRGSTAAGSSPTVRCDPDEDCFVEFRTTKESTYNDAVCPGCAATTPVCTQWWMDAGTGTLYWRWWQDVTTPTRSAPIVAASGLQSNASKAVFVPGFSSQDVTTFPLQQLVVTLTAARGLVDSTRQVSYTARNSQSFYQQQVADGWAGSACESVDRSP